VKRFLKWVRGALGTATTWAFTWSGVSVAVIGLQSILGSGLPSVMTLPVILTSVVATGLSGFLTGLVFSTYVGLAHRNRSILEIRLSRFVLGGLLIGAAAWPLIMIGILAANGSIIPGITMRTDVITSIALRSGLLGAFSAAWTLRVAKKSAKKIAASDLDQLESEQAEIAALLGEGRSSR
jgi:hypothetical protein